MNRIRKRWEGFIRVEICGAYPEALLNACAAGGIRLEELERPDTVTLRAGVKEGDLSKLRAAAENCCCELSILSHSGGSRNRRFLRRRAVLLTAALLAGAALMISSLFLWQIDVRGCENLSEGEVLRALSECGVETGCYWPGLSADLVRSHMLARLPELAWMTVNVSGSRAVVLVQERREKPELEAEGPPCDLVASRPGIIERLSVLDGLPLVEPGQAVLTGETLVSGSVSSLSRPTRILRARGSVTAETRYELTAVRPLAEHVKSGGNRIRNRFALQIGKNRINFWWKSGKELDECDKIIHKYNLGAKGLFALPLNLIREERIFREYSVQNDREAESMRQHLLAMLRDEIDGEILSAEFETTEQDGLLSVTLRARCSENIAQIRDIGS